MPLDPILATLNGDIQSALQQHPTTLTLDAALLGTHGGEVVALFGELFFDPTLVLKPPGAGAITVTPDEAANTLTVSGWSDDSLYDIDDARLVCMFGVAGGATLTLIVQVTPPPGSSWAFSTSFFFLQGTFFEQLAFTNPAILLASRPATYPALGVRVGHGVTMYIQPTGMTGPLAIALQLVSGNFTSVTHFAGPLVETNQTSELRMAMPFADVRLEVAGMPLVAMTNSQLVLRSAYIYDPASDSSGSVDSLTVESDVRFGGLSLPLYINVPVNGEYWQFGLIPGRSVSIASLLTFLSGLSPVDVLSLMPADVIGLPGFFLNAFVVEFNLSTRQFSHFSTALSTTDASGVVGPSAWKIIPGFIEINDLTLIFEYDRIARPDGTIIAETSGEISGTFAITSNFALKLTIPIPLGGQWRLYTDSHVQSFDFGDIVRLLGGANAAALLPPGLAAIGGFTLDFAELVVTPAQLTFDSFTFRVFSTSDWVIIPSRLVIKNVVIALNFDQPLTARLLTGVVAGTIMIGSAAITIQVERPVAPGDWLLQVTSDAIPLPSLNDIAGLAGTDLTQYLPAGVANASFTIFDLLIRADITQGRMEQLQFTIVSSSVWDIFPGSFSINRFGFNLSLSWTTGELFPYFFAFADFVLLGKRILLSAEMLPNYDWNFRGELAPGETLSLGALINELLKLAHIGLTLPALNVTGIVVTFGLRRADSSKNTYSIEGRTAGFWEFQITSGLVLKMAAAVRFEKTETGGYAGFIKGEFFVNNLQLFAIYQFNPTANTVIFRVVYKRLEVTAALISTAERTLLEITLGDLTFGEMIEYLVNLAVPGADFQLSAPWDVLNEINFKNLKLTVDLTNNTVGISYALDLNLGFMSITSVGLVYLIDGTGDDAVRIQLTGRFLDQEYDSNQPLAWDVLKEDPPAVSGQSDLLDLKYLGLGQHVAFADVSHINSVADAISALETYMLPVEDTTRPPLSQTTGLQFDADSSVLFGVDFVVMGTVSLSVVLNDPYLYGLLLKLSGERAGSFAGLSFELLYKKVADDIGVFKIELRVPDAFRQLEFGEVSITLPIIKVDIYTNGNFRVDLGFPVNRNFANSFSLQVFPFVGFGGVYFALLTGATSERVPRITNGTFDPVIEFGLGLSVGVGKEINKGVLKAGLSITAEAILEGVVAWFNPNDPAVRSDRYFWLQGTASLVGRLYGAVDFKVIKVSVSVTAFASVTLTIAAYQPIYIALVVSVSVEATVTVLFINVHFSFDLELNQSFTIGQSRPTPWIVDRAAPARQPAPRAAHMLRQQAFAVRMTREVSFAAAAVLGTREQQRLPDGTLLLDWNPVAVFGAPQPIMLTLLPALTIALPVDRQTGRPSGNTPQLQIVMLPFVENGIAQQGNGAAAPTPFDLLVKGMLGWAIDTYPKAVQGAIARTELEDLYKTLDHEQTENSGFSYARLVSFIGLNYVLRIGGLPDGSDYHANSTSATIFPIIPDLSMRPDGQPLFSFSAAHNVDARYERNIAAYFQRLAVDYAASVANDPFAPQDGAPMLLGAEDETGESMATLIFRDYFLMIAKSAVQAALDLLDAFPYQVQPGDTLLGIAAQFERRYAVQPGDTVAEILYTFDMTAAEFAALNDVRSIADPLTAGTIYVVRGGPTPATIMHANQDVALFVPADPAVEPPTVLQMRNVKHQVRDGETLNGIAARFAITVTAMIAEQLDDRTLLRVGAGFLVAQEGRGGTTAALDFVHGTNLGPPIGDGMNGPGGPQIDFAPRFSYTLQQGDTLDLVAAILYGRAGDVAQSALAGPNLNWYRQAVVDLNPAIDFAPQPPATLPAGTLINIPAALNISTNPSDYPGGKTPQQYLIRAGDTLDLIAAYLLLLQTRAADLQFARQAITLLNPTVNFAALAPNSALALPGFVHQIRSDDTLRSLAAIFDLDVDTLAANNAGAAILAPLAVLTLPLVQHTVVAGDTLAGIAAHYDLSLEELADDIAATANIFKHSDAFEIALPSLPEAPIAGLLAEVTHHRQSNTIAATVSRFLLHGLRLPDPADATFKALSEATIAALEFAGIGLFSLYALTGQQVPALAQPGGNYTIRFTKNVTPDDQLNWIAFVSTHIVTAQDTYAALSGQYPQFAQLNPGLSPNTPLTTGAVVMLATTAELDITLTPELINHDAPGTTFAPALVAGPGALPLFRSVPRRYTLQKSIHWQSAVAPALPGLTAQNQPASWQPTLWLFPDTLSERLAREPSAAFELVTGRMFKDPLMKTAPVSFYMWGTLIAFDVRRISATKDSATLMPNTYEVLGADDNGRDQLLAIVRYLRQTGETNTQLYLLYSPGADSDNPSGLASDSLDVGGTFLLKTNLSTLTTSGRSQPFARQFRPMTLGAETQQELFYASLHGDPREFLTLLWEASIIGTGGYYLNYIDSVTRGGLPESVFATQSTASLRLLVVLAAQSGSSPDRTLHPFTTCAVVADNIDPAQTNVFAEVPNLADMVRVRSVSPGNIGFELMRTSPESEGDTPDSRVRKLYSLLSYQVAASDTFAASAEGLPVGPTKPDPASGLQPPGPPVIGGGDGDGIATLDGAPAPPQPSLWHYHQIVPIARFAKVHQLPECPALPDPLQDPYAGIAIEPAGDGGQKQVKRATIAFAFHDVFGNLINPQQPLLPLPIPVGYIDEVIGLSQWPGLGSFYEVYGVGGAPHIRTTLALQLANYVPGAGTSLKAALLNASGHAARYKQVYYQLMRADVALNLTTSLNQTGAAPHVYALDKQPALDYASAAYIFLGTAQQLRDLQVTIGTDATLTSFAAAYQVPVAAVGEANADVALSDLFATALKIPTYVTTQHGGTLAAIVDQANLDYPEGDPVTVQGVALHNGGAPLFAGTIITTPQRSATFGAGGMNTLARLAQANFVAVADLVALNAGTPNLFTVGKTLTVRGATVTVQDANTTFTSLVAAFANVNRRTTVAEIAFANQDVADLLLSGKTLNFTGYVVQPGDTFDKLQQFNALFAPGTLADLNKGVEDVFAPDLLLFVKERAPVSPTADQTLNRVALNRRLSVRQIVEYNRMIALIRGKQLAVPYRVTLGTAGALYAPYVVQSGDSLQDIALKLRPGAAQADLDVLARAIAQDNQALPGRLNPGSATVPSQTVDIVAGDTLVAVLAKLQAKDVAITFEQMVTALQASTSLLKAGALLVVTLPRTGGATSIAALTTAFGNTAEAFAQANAALNGLLAPGVKVSPRPPAVSGADPDALEVRANDTFGTLVSRFQAEKGILTTVEMIAATPANQAQPLIAAGQVWLLPPAPVALEVDLGAGYAAAPNFSAPIFQVVTALEVARDPNYLAPDFKDVAAVRGARTAIAPHTQPGAATGNLSLQAFATAFEAVFPRVKLGTGRTDIDASGAAREQQLWAVNFGTGGISSVTIDGAAPSYYALKPLASTLITRPGVPIRPYDPQIGQLGAQALLTFENVDLDVWMRDFLEAVDLFLSPGYALPAYRADAGIYNRVVAAKKQLAQAVAAGVDYILDVARDDDRLQAAREALRQSLLISLSNAFTTDVIIQYPSSATSPFAPESAGSLDLPPSLSGQALARVYVTGAADTIQTLATFYSVSAEHVTAHIQHMPRTLNTQLVLSYTGSNKPPFAVQPASTLADVAQYFGAPVDTLAQNLTWDSAKGGLFAARTTINISGLSKLVTGTPTIEAMSVFFDIPVDEFAQANQYNPEFFVEGALIDFANQAPVTVTSANNTLEKIADALATTPLDLAQWLRDRTGILNPGFTAHIVEILFEYTLSSAKVPLANGASAVSFLFNLKNEGEHKKVFLNLDYSINELEYDIKKVRLQNEDTGYHSSSWLSFIIPIGRRAADHEVFDTRLGQAEIPVPLRFYPALPTVISQSGAASVAYPRSVSAAKQWDYTFVYEQQEVAQDTTYLQVSFNIGGAPQGPLTLAEAPPVLPDDTTIFGRLAQFISVYPQLRAELANLLLYSGGDDPVLKSAIGTFATLVENVAASWAFPPEHHASASVLGLADPPANTFEYRARTTINDVEQRLNTLILSRVSQQKRPPVSDPLITPATPSSPATIAAQYHVGAAYVVRVTAPMQGILNAGISVSYPGAGSYTIGASDTLNDVMGHFHITPEQLAQDLQLPAGQGLYKPNTPINIAGASAGVGAATTFTVLAQALNTTLEDLALANQQNTGIFADGVTLRLPRYAQHPGLTISAANNSLAGVAAAFAAALNVPITPVNVVEELRDTAGILNTHFTAFILQSDQFPQVAWIDGAGARVPLLKLKESVEECVYQYPLGVPAFGAVQQALTFNGLDVVAYQNAQGGVFLTRNQDLVGGARTQEPFVYETPLVLFADPMTPLIVHNELIVLAALAGEARLDVLRRLFADLLGTAARDIKVAVSFGYELIEAARPPAFAPPVERPEPIISLLAVLYSPRTPFSAGFVTQLDAAIQGWESAQTLPSAGGLYVFDVSVFSALDNTMVRPLLDIERLGYFTSSNQEQSPIIEDVEGGGGMLIG